MCPLWPSHFPSPFTLNCNVKFNINRKKRTSEITSFEGLVLIHPSTVQACLQSVCSTYHCYVHSHLLVRKREHGSNWGWYRRKSFIVRNQVGQISQRNSIAVVRPGAFLFNPASNLETFKGIGLCWVNFAHALLRSNTRCNLKTVLRLVLKGSFP